MLLWRCSKDKIYSKELLKGGEKQKSTLFVEFTFKATFEDIREIKRQRELS